MVAMDDVKRYQVLVKCENGGAVWCAAVLEDDYEALVASLVEVERERDEANERADRCSRERREALNVKTREGLTASEWLLRTGQAEARVERLVDALRVAKAALVKAAADLVRAAVGIEAEDGRLAERIRDQADEAKRAADALPVDHRPPALADAPGQKDQVPK